MPVSFQPLVQTMWNRPSGPRAMHGSRISLVGPTVGARKLAPPRSASHW